MALDAIKSDINKEIYALGPLLSADYGTGENETSIDIEEFLGKMLVQHGERSVFFVRSLLHC